VVHQVYLSLGSNIQPELHLPQAIELLNEYGEVLKVSNAWESEAVGSDGPNFLNACVLIHTPLLAAELKEKVIHPIEATLGRIRSADKYAPRTIDIDIVLFDDQLCDEKYWQQMFVIIPLAEIYPRYRNPRTNERVLERAKWLRQNVWMKNRPAILRQFSGGNFKSDL
jgi:2-amino-4-hydroxy-6-hydroxymethyldihydropteridine diphosphokinase